MYYGADRTSFLILILEEREREREKKTDKGYAVQAARCQKEYFKLRLISTEQTSANRGPDSRFVLEVCPRGDYQSSDI